jgi:hypothetical protein
MIKSFEIWRLALVTPEIKERKMEHADIMKSINQTVTGGLSTDVKVSVPADATWQELVILQERQSDGSWKSYPPAIVAPGNTMRVHPSDGIRWLIERQNLPELATAAA